MKDTFPESIPRLSEGRGVVVVSIEENRPRPGDRRVDTPVRSTLKLLDRIGVTEYVGDQWDADPGSRTCPSV